MWLRRNLYPHILTLRLSIQENATSEREGWSSQVDLSVSTCVPFVKSVAREIDEVPAQLAETSQYDNRASMMMNNRFLAVMLALFAIPACGSQAQDSTEKLCVPDNQAVWDSTSKAWMDELKSEQFGSWPQQPISEKTKTLFSVKHEGVALKAIEFQTREGSTARLYIAGRDGLENFDLVVLSPVDQKGWQEFVATYRVGFEKQLATGNAPAADKKSFGQTARMFHSFKWAMAYLRLPTEVENRNACSNRTCELRRAIQTLRSAGGMKDVSLWLQGTGDTSAVVLFASLFEPKVTRLDLYDLPLDGSEKAARLITGSSLSMQGLVAMAAQKSKVVIYQDEKSGWEYPQSVVEKLNWGKNLQIRGLPQFDE